ncbi:DUF1569 domain-containing protein [Faecalibacter bovis]|uniref:DUF1569 domain-containing protein n=1 Tax=Faecalibacter bovis TaxID=2898187 RepID=A0ABX7XCP5_9FLAO|nr:DUF1569 domain-containing protein [Faecalibacter bovis]MBS7332173.1 DUF1569 domain-containing protein [Weeksellaceae bacterium]QTV05671.1 DUF1569 domain-containing protein [Faecalibacter bovis]
MKANIDQTSEIINLLKSLPLDKQPVWGIMTPQHMVEHLIVSMKMSNGGFIIPCRTPKEMIPKYKEVVLNPDIEMERGIKAGGMEGLLDLRYPTMDAAIEKLQSEIEKFHEYFQSNPGILMMNPVVDEIGYEDWKIFHNKHFTHHFKQFELI